MPIFLSRKPAQIKSTKERWTTEKNKFPELTAQYDDDRRGTGVDIRVRIKFGNVGDIQFALYDVSDWEDHHGQESQGLKAHVDDHKQRIVDDDSDEEERGDDQGDNSEVEKPVGEQSNFFLEQVADQRTGKKCHSNQKKATLCRITISKLFNFLLKILAVCGLKT